METLSSHEKFYIDPVLYHGRPAEDSGRLEKEQKTYDLLDLSLIHISEPTRP